MRLLGILVAASLVLPISLFAGFSYLSYKAHIATAETRLAQTLDVAYEHVRKVFETHVLAVLHVEDLVRGQNLAELRVNEAQLHERLEVLKAALPQARDIWIVDAAGFPVASAVMMPFPRQISFADREHFRFHKEGRGDSYVTEVMESRIKKGDHYFLQTHALRDDQGVFQGMAAISVEPGYFAKFFSGFPSGYVFSLVREDGAVLARFPDIGNGASRLQPGRGLLAEIERSPLGGKYRAVSGVDGVERLASYRRLDSQPVYVTANFAMSDVARQWRTDMLSHLLLAGPATAGLFLITLLAYAQALGERQAAERLREEIELRQRMEAQLLQAQKMEAVGRLTGGIAHDFNNLLTVILGNLESVSRQLPEGSDRVRRAVSNAQLGAERAASLTHRLLAFSRRQPLESKSVDLNAIVSDMADLMRRTIGENIAIESKLAAGLWITRADANQIENGLLNLVINARDAMPDGGRLVIETANVEITEDDDAARKQGAVPGQYAELSVADSGTGIAADVLDMVFEPFFTTKPTGQGTGLGLSMVYGFMQQTGGHVRIDSAIGQGTTVRLFFPRSESDELPPAAGRKSDIPIEVTGDGETILVCEDDEGVRNLSTATLRDLGYRVVEAGTMGAALEQLDAHPEIVALFTDVVLPQGNGRMLADEALRRRPYLKVLFTTGYTRDAIVRDGHLQEGVELLTKPFASADLARRIRDLLAG